MKRLPNDSFDQLSLFHDDSKIKNQDDELILLASKLPKHLRLGTSSWTFSGWKDIVYFHKYLNEKSFLRDSLHEYCQFPLFRTVGIDRSYYAPISLEDLQLYVKQVPSDFIPIAKVWSEITTHTFPFHPRYQERAGKNNPHFLNAALFEESMGVAFTKAWENRRIPFILEFPPTPMEVNSFYKLLDQFLSQLSDRYRFAVEIRQKELLTTRYLQILKAHKVSHVYNYWERMPDLVYQYQKVGMPENSVVIVRVMLTPGQKYEDQKRAFEPFDHIVIPQYEMRSQVVSLIDKAAEAQSEIFVLVSNKAEGCAPLTVKALAHALTER